eukprot:Skav213050  [mRNA]  locus=scaffold364:31684:34669:+ [translate_table: standard]
MAGQGVPIKSLAKWKCWWTGTSLASEIATAIQKNIDVSALPGGGKLVKLQHGNKVVQADLQNSMNNKVMEAVVDAYPSDRDPSAYLLGDTVLHLNNNLNGVLFGMQRPNPIDEDARRKVALKQGTYLKMMLSYLRTIAGRASSGRNPHVTYLKELTLAKGLRGGGGRGKGSPSASPAPSSASSCSSHLSAATTIMDGNPLVASSSSGSVEFEDLGALPTHSLEQAFGRAAVDGDGDNGVAAPEPLGPAAICEKEDAKDTPIETTGPDPNAMPKPGEQLLRRRSKGPALTRPMSSEPLVPPDEPKQIVVGGVPDVAVVNPHDQLQLVDSSKPKRPAKKRAVAAAEAKAEGEDPSKKAKVQEEMLPVPEGMPAECLPPNESKRGRLSYTISNDASGARVEVLLKARAFRVVKMSPFDQHGAPLPIPPVKQKPWGQDISAAWEGMKAMVGWRSAR